MIVCVQLPLPSKKAGRETFSPIFLRGRGGGCTQAISELDLTNHSFFAQVDLLIVIGSSLKVRPVALIPSKCMKQIFTCFHNCTIHVGDDLPCLHLQY